MYIVLQTKVSDKSGVMDKSLSIEARAWAIKSRYSTKKFLFRFIYCFHYVYSYFVLSGKLVGTIHDRTR